MVVSLALSEDRTFLFVGIEADNFRIGWKVRRNWQWLCTLSAIRYRLIVELVCCNSHAAIASSAILRV